ncbi:MaoC family dehydratase [Microbacterium sp. ARD31]|uniref:MaoC family dehydratase n=1 Tax=Microbacterium sp. ARD31 TaxID=2962576 RepID=UPI002881CD24|nr:MaoC family dehydratase [Microbacterium sp. ARD31]MDT0186065.1 MaoC family dehydratase [Microbacterium sp. ARD31]
MTPLETSYGDIDDLVGRELGVADWCLVDQARVTEFARVTGDDQWIHTDGARAASGPFGGTVVHGYLSLAMLPMMTRTVLQIAGLASVINYGVNRVRFPRPIRVGLAVRDRITVRAVETSSVSKRLVLTHTVEIDDGGAKPGCVAETISLLIPAAGQDAA